MIWSAKAEGTCSLCFLYFISRISAKSLQIPLLSTSLAGSEMSRARGFTHPQSEVRIGAIQHSI
jgi:hypothetical protein